MLNIAVVGCGIIGSRHAQALAQLNETANLYLIDPIKEAREKTLALLADKPAQLTVIEREAFFDLPDSFDVAIIATGAPIRRKLTENLLDLCYVKHLILEKFLFQSVNDYAAISKLIAEKKAPTWVNCPRRVWPGYKELKKELGKAPKGISLETATYGRYGVGTSAIHMLDTLAFLADEDEFNLCANLLDTTVVQHRSGGIDLTGSLYGAGRNGSFFRYTAYQAGALPPLTIIDAPHMRAIIDEAKQSMRISKENDDWQWTKKPFGIYYQSQMTHNLVHDLVTTGRCDLTDFETSSRLHLSILEPLLKHYRTHCDPEALACPIT